MTRAAALMIQGTASSVGKSLIVAGLCRFFARAGYRVAPFKAQNMALNSYVTATGGEMGRAQVVQAEAAGIAPTVDMNPILLKPEAAARSQIVVRGRAQGTLSARDFLRKKLELWPVVAESLDRLRATHDLVVIEGAGSPAEINLKAGDIVNMRVARYADSPVLLVGDIDRGGVFAALLGTMQLLETAEAALVAGFLINKFRGDPDLLAPGLTMIEERTGRPVLGVIPYLPDLAIAEEDSVALEEWRPTRTIGASGSDASGRGTGLDIVVLRLAHTANFDDFDPLAREPGVRLRYVGTPDDLGAPDLIILPGTKTTVYDLDQIRASGLADRVLDRARSGTPLIGICGGYQMLGEWLLDPDRVEADRDRTPGLGLLPVTTRFQPSKHTYQVRGSLRAGPGLVAGLAGIEVAGYEIHVGESIGPVPPLIDLTERLGWPVSDPDGAIDPSGRIFGTYLHGLFANETFRRGLLTNLARLTGRAWTPAPVRQPIDPYERLADAIEAAIGGDRLIGLIRSGRAAR